MSCEVPEGWSSIKLSDAAGIFLGQSPSSSETNDQGLGLPFFQGNAEFGEHYPVPRRWAATGPRLAEKGDILISVRAPVGELNLAPVNCVIGRGLGAIRATKIDNAFLWHALKFCVPQLHSVSQGSTFEAVNRGDLSKLELPSPPLHEQRRIAEILSSVDEAIAATRAVIEQTRKVKQGVLERLLTKGIGHTRFKQTEIGEIPEGWDVVELDKITPHDRKITYGIVQAGPNYPEGVPYIRVSDMGEYQIEEGRVLRTSPEIASKYLRSELQHDDIVFALRGKVGHVLRTPQSLNGANLTQGTARIACGSLVLSEFLLWALRSPESERQYKREIKGSTFQELTLGSLKRIRVPLPPLKEQQLLARCIEDVEAVLRSSESSLMSLLVAKSALMSDLLTGRKRVIDALPMAAE